MNKFFVLLLGLLAACTTTAPTPTPPSSAWGTVFTLGQAEQTDAPAIWPFPDHLMATWIGADETGIHQDSRTLSKTGLSERVVLPLPPKNPYAQQMFPAGDHNTQVLWLDANPDGDVRLYAAIISPTLTVERGPTMITDQTTRRYTAILNGDGSLWAISSGGLLIEPRLYVNFIDPQGRPHLDEKDLVATDADWPTIAQANDGSTTVFWIHPSDNRVLRSTFSDGQLQNPEAITDTVTLNPGDRLVSFQAGLDASRMYLFWNVSRANGQAEAWFTSGTSDAPTWPAPQSLSLDTTSDHFETGFNSGTANAARAGSHWLSWAAVMPGQFDSLPVGAVNAGKLGIVYLHDGIVAGYQDIIPVSGLIGLPILLTDRDRFLYLAWSEPNFATGKADLKLTMTKGF
ncbi:MAG: hypothetical protein ABI690_19490 [Chloroflexota bacterium]